LRSSEFQAEFEQNGFMLFDFEINMTGSADYLRDFMPRLRASTSRYRKWAENDLAITSGFMKFRMMRAGH
jgi:hypothetical protein